LARKGVCVSALLALLRMSGLLRAWKHTYVMITDSTYCVGICLILNYLFCLVLFSSVLCCSKKCVLFYLFLYVWILLFIFVCMNFAWVGFLWVCWSPKWFYSQRIRKHWFFKYITSVVMNHVFVIVYTFLPFWALPKSFCCVNIRNVFR
jgi:hypothetical protein